MRTPGGSPDSGRELRGWPRETRWWSTAGGGAGIAASAWAARSSCATERAGRAWDRTAAQRRRGPGGGDRLRGHRRHHEAGYLWLGIFELSSMTAVAGEV